MSEMSIDGSSSFAPKTTHISGINGTTVIEDGEPIKVWGILIGTNSTTSAPVSCKIQDADGNVLFPDFSANFKTDAPPARTENRYHIVKTFLADNGLQIVTESPSFTVTVFHSHPGA